MTEIPKGFVPVKQVAERFNTSRSTLDRRRAKAQQGSDEVVLRQFLLRTRDGEIHQAPSREQVQQFIKHGLVPEWFVSKTWLKKEYGERQAGESTQAEQPAGQSAGHSISGDAAITALKQQYDERIGDLKQQLQQEREEKQQLLQYAQSDKQLFGNAVSNLTKVLTLPGMASAIDTANRQLVDGTSQDHEPTDDGGAKQPQPSAPQSKRKTSSKPSGKSNTASSKSSQRKSQPKSKRKWFRWGSA